MAFYWRSKAPKPFPYSNNSVERISAACPALAIETSKFKA